LPTIVFGSMLLLSIYAHCAKMHKTVVWIIHKYSIRISGSLIREKLMSGKILICWRHDLTSQVARRRYLQNQDSLRSAHGEIANLFFSEFAQQGSDADTEEAGEDTCIIYLITYIFVIQLLT